MVHAVTSASTGRASLRDGVRSPLTHHHVEEPNPDKGDGEGLGSSPISRRADDSGDGNADHSLRPPEVGLSPLFNVDHVVVSW